LSKQYVDISYCFLHVSDIQTSIKWYCELFGFQVLDVSSQNAVLEISPGQIFCLSTDDKAAKEFVILCKEVEPIRQRVIDHKISLEEDLPHWLVFRDPDHNEVGVWLVPEVDFEMPNEFIYDTIRFNLESREESHFVIRSIVDQSDYKSASEALIKDCKEIGVIPQDVAITITKFSDQVDAFYIGVPMKVAPSQNLPEGSEYIVIPAQEYSVYPIHKSKLEDQRTTQLVNRVQHSDKTLCRPNQFYILEHYIDEEYIEAYIPYVWSDTQL
jgi:predicted transcriptional regulator YdeE